MREKCGCESCREFHTPQGPTYEVRDDEGKLLGWAAEIDGEPAIIDAASDKVIRVLPPLPPELEDDA